MKRYKINKEKFSNFLASVGIIVMWFAVSLCFWWVYAGGRI